MPGWWVPYPSLRTLYWSPEGRVTTPSFLEFSASHFSDSGFDAKHMLRRVMQSRVRSGAFDVIIVKEFCEHSSTVIVYRDGTLACVLGGGSVLPG